METIRISILIDDLQRKIENIMNTEPFNDKTRIKVGTMMQIQEYLKNLRDLP